MQDGMGMGMSMGFPMMFMMGAIFGVVGIVAFWRISAKAGFPGWYPFAVVIPMVNLLFILFLAFAEWPIERTRSMSQPSSGA